MNTDSYLTHVHIYLLNCIALAYTHWHHGIQRNEICR